jgi:hypothetical protein
MKHDRHDTNNKKRGNMSNIFTDETRNEDRFKRLSVIAINTLVFEHFKHFDVHGMSGSVDIFHGPNESGKTSLMEVIPWTIAMARNEDKAGTRHFLDTRLRHLIEVFERENVLNVEQLHEVSILEELKLSENPQCEAQIEFVVAETLELLREICLPTNVFGEIVHSVNDAKELDQALKMRGDNNRLLVNFTFRLLQLIIMNRQKQIRLPIIIDDLPQSLSDDYLHLMAKIMKKASRICQIIATTADPKVVKVLDENRINIIDMDSCRPA